MPAIHGAQAAPLMIGVREAAEYTGYSVRYLYKLTSEGRIPHYKPQGGKVFFALPDLQAFLARGRVAANYELEEEAEATLTGGRK